MSDNKIKIKYVISDNICMLSCGDICLFKYFHKRQFANKIRTRISNKHMAQ